MPRTFKWLQTQPPELGKLSVKNDLKRAIFVNEENKHVENSKSFFLKKKKNLAILQQITYAGYVY